MLKFKDLLKNDARQIMSVIEFAEFLVVDGVLMACQFVPSTAEFTTANEQKPGLYGDIAELYFKTSDYTGKRERIPRQGEYVYLQTGNFKRRYQVLSSADELGVTCLKLSTHRQNTLRNQAVWQE